MTTAEQRAHNAEYMRNYRALHPEKREAAKLRIRAWRAADPDRARQTHHRHQIGRYGLTIDTFAALLTAQDGRCAICREPIGQNANVDHDHASGRNRGLLCRKCNRGLGLAHDNAELLQSAIAYLRR